VTAVPAPSALWLAVVTAAEGQCECPGSCGPKTHFGRCERENDPESTAGLLRLVSRADPGLAAERITGLAAGELAAYCPRCQHLAALLRRRELATPAAAPALFGDAA
jgi:hypothetical protein